ncbi:hypothetical protein N836_22990 [Leptolyngbya sp. Heron Island J]|nr:hypothetical protein N836_22990 [Leptolyngbya sp. Heron Island J]
MVWYKTVLIAIFRGDQSIVEMAVTVVLQVF